MFKQIVYFKSLLSHLLLSKKNIHGNYFEYSSSCCTFWNYQTGINYLNKVAGCWKSFWLVNLISTIDFCLNKYNISSVYLQNLHSFLWKRNTYIKLKSSKKSILVKYFSLKKKIIWFIWNYSVCISKNCRLLYYK